MIVFFANGRLGNQIFQYVFLKTIQENNEKIVVCGFDDLLNVFELNDDTIISLPNRNKLIRRFVYKVFDPICNKLSDFRFINSIKVKHEKILEKYRRESTEICNIKGLIKNINFVKLGYFQSENFFNRESIKNLKIKEKFTLKAKEFLKQYENNYKVFIHIRRGDYKNFFVYGKETILPMSYFHNQIKWFLENKKKMSFLYF